MMDHVHICRPVLLMMHRIGRLLLELDMMMLLLLIGMPVAYMHGRVANTTSGHRRLTTGHHYHSGRLLMITTWSRTATDIGPVVRGTAAVHVWRLLIVSAARIHLFARKKRTLN